MLTKLVIFNSQKHAEVIINFNDATAIQIIGENKVGKTTLIDALNFLYIIVPSKMSFDTRGGKSTYTFKESVPHFFPTHNRSFIIFECFKAKAGGYFSVLVKRKTNENDVEYFLINKLFTKSDYISTNNELKKFDTIYKFFQNNIKELKNKTDFFKYVYNKDKKQKAFVWTTDKVKRKGLSLSNSLSKVYLHLLNAGSIDDSSLREALMIADNRQSSSLKTFSNTSSFDRIEQLKKESDYLNKLNQIKTSFEDFKFLVNSYKRTNKKIIQLLQDFYFVWKRETKTVTQQIVTANAQIVTLNKEKNIHSSKQSDLLREIGALETKIKNLKDDKPHNKGKITQKEEILEKINDILKNTNFLYTTVETLIPFLEKEANNLQQQIDSITGDLQLISRYKQTVRGINRTIASLKEKIGRLEKQIENYENSFIRNISDSKLIQERLNAVFSKNILANLTKENIVSKIEHFDDILNINDGTINGLDNITSSAIESIEDLQAKLEQAKQELSQKKDILNTILNRKQQEAKKSKLQDKLNDYNSKITMLNKKQTIVQQLIELRKELDTLEKSLKEKKATSTTITNELTKTSNAITEQNNKIIDFKTRKQQYEIWYNEFEEDMKYMDSEEVQMIDASLEQLADKLREEKKAFISQKIKKEKKLQDLQKAIQDYSNEHIFIKKVQQDILAIHDKEKSIESLLETISHTISQPVTLFLKEYQHFAGYVKKFNRKIAEYSITNLTSLKIELKVNETLHQDLEDIGKINKIDVDIFSQNSKNEQPALKKLEQYIKENKIVHFKDLFEVSLIANDENGKSKRINLKVGNESQGTIRMINLLLFLLVIKEFKVQDDENKLVFVIDEDKIDSSNTHQLINFCKENGFIVVFAAKHQIIGLEKYYALKERILINGEKKLIVNERHAQFTKKRND